MNAEQIRKIGLIKIATPPSSLSEEQQTAWYDGLCFGIDRVVEKILKSEL